MFKIGSEIILFYRFVKFDELTPTKTFHDSWLAKDISWLNEVNEEERVNVL